MLNKLKEGSLSIKDFDQRNPLTNYIITQLPKLKAINQGAVGRVYEIGQYVVKQIKPCLKKNSRYCTDLSKPITLTKRRFAIPNLLSEILIGSLLNSPFVAKTITSFILNDNEIYIVMEKLTPFILKNQLTLTLSEVDFVILLFQLSYALLDLQQRYQFTHYDLHGENILYLDNNNPITFPLPNKSKSIRLNCPFVIKLADFALSRMTINEITIGPMQDQFPVKSFGEFNHSYDFASVLGSILFYEPFKLTLSLKRFILSLTSWYYRKEMSFDNIINLYKIAKGKPTFRLREVDNYVMYVNTRSLVDVVNYLARNLVNSGFAQYTASTLNLYRYYDDIKLLRPNKLIEFGNIKLIKKTFHFNAPPSIYNFTVEKEQLKRCPSQHHSFSFLSIPKNSSTFFYDCCKIDCVNYLVQNPSIRLVINGGFFNIKEDYLPIGPYRDRDISISRYRIPELYSKDYAYVSLNNNVLSIHQQQGSGQIFASGPLLIHQGKIVFDPHHKRFMCQEKKYTDLILKEEEETIITGGVYVYDKDCNQTLIPTVNRFQRCDKIKPGTLYHADNPNPRTVFCILKNGDYLFVAVEGREKNGDGLDLFKLAEILMTNFNVDQAINLDGGRSSTMACRYQNKVYYTNPFRNYYYPVGMVIGLK